MQLFLQQRIGSSLHKRITNFLHLASVISNVNIDWCISIDWPVKSRHASATLKLAILWVCADKNTNSCNMRQLTWRRPYANQSHCCQRICRLIFFYSACDKLVKTDQSFAIRRFCVNLPPQGNFTGLFYHENNYNRKAFVPFCLTKDFAIELAKVNLQKIFLFLQDWVLQRINQKCASFKVMH